MSDAHEEVRRELLALARRHPGTAETVIHILSLLEGARSPPTGEPVGDPKPRPGGTRHGRRVDRQYLLGDRSGETVLVERRPDANDFYVSHEIYEKTVSSLLDSDEPVKFATLLARLNGGRADPLADYLVRTVLRLLVDHKLVAKAHAMYSPVRRSEFRAAARRLWNGLDRAS